MKTRLMILLAWTLVLFPALSQNQDVKIREHLLMDFGWRFALGHATDYQKDFATRTPAKVALLADRTQLNADGEDAAVITVQY
jgi:hypothetical protein